VRPLPTAAIAALGVVAALAPLAGSSILRARAAGASRSASAPAGDAAGTGAAERLIGRLLGPTPAEEDLRFLCDRIGGRPTGGAANERAVDWFVQRFREAGVEKVTAEPAPIPRRWEETSARASLVAPETRALHVVAMPSSPATPAGGLEAPLVDVGEGDGTGFERAGPRARGAILLVSSKILVGFDDLFADYLRLPPILERARAAGAAGLLFVGGRAGNVLYRHVASMNLKPAPLPIAILAREEGLRLQRLASSGPPRLRLELDLVQGPGFAARNVVAEIPGTDLKDEIVVAGAHVDSWDLGTGALDNGANCVLLLDVARQMRSLGLRPRRSIRFVLFNGEEQGMFGSWDYVRAHHAEMGRHAAMVTVDTGTGRIVGFSLGGRADLRPAVAAALAPASGFDASATTTDAFVGTDNFDFLLEGIPNLVANQEPANYMESYHASTDTFDKADMAMLHANAAVTGTLVWGLANAPERATRQERAAIQALLDATGLAEEMRTFDLYDDWAARRRGRAD
jgi:hypothetical protein